MTSPIDEIKAKLDIIEVISEYLKLLPAGTNFKALCPFHSEKVPSFFVSPEKQIWKCFGCSKGGSIFDFVMEIEGVDFPQALRILAKKAGLVFKTYDPYLTSKRTKILDICQQAAQYYHWLLLNAKVAEPARRYLKERKISLKTIKEWQLGFSPKARQTLLNYLKKKGFKTEDIEEAGLIIFRIEPELRRIKANNLRNVQDTSGETQESLYYDRFRGRIIFPLHDVFGNIIGFTGRIMPDEEKKEGVAKYINTPETLVYNKSCFLYGLDKAKLEIKKKKFAILVEGNMDVLASWQAGIKNVIASSGSSLSLNQIKLLKRYTQNLILAFDLDLAGETATKRGIDIALQEEMNVKVITSLSGKDPDECIRENPKLWLKAIKKSQLIMAYYFSSTFKNFDLKKNSSRKEAVKILLPLIAKIGNLVERDIWLRKLAEQINVSYETIRELFQSIKLEKKITKEMEQTLTKNFDQVKILEEKFSGFLLKFPEQISSYYDEIDLDFFQEEKIKKIIIALKKYYSQVALENKKINLVDFKKSLAEEELSQYIDFLILAIEKDFSEENKKDIDRELEFIFLRLKKNFIVKKLKEIEVEIRRAEDDQDEKKIRELSQQFNELSKKLIS